MMLAVGEGDAFCCKLGRLGRLGGVCGGGGARYLCGFLMKTVSACSCAGCGDVDGCFACVSGTEGCGDAVGGGDAVFCGAVVGCGEEEEGCAEPAVSMSGLGRCAGSCVAERLVMTGCTCVASSSAPVSSRGAVLERVYPLLLPEMLRHEKMAEDRRRPRLGRMKGPSSSS